MPIFYAPWDKVRHLRKLCEPKIIRLLSKGDLGFAVALLDQIDQEWAKDKDNYERFVKRGEEYDKSARRSGDEGESDEHRRIDGPSAEHSEEQVRGKASKEGDNEEEEHF